MDEKQQDSSLHFLDYWRVIRARKEIIITVSVLIILTVFIITLIMPEKYRASVRITIDQYRPDIELVDRGRQSQYDPYFYLTQFELIRSRPVLTGVIRDMNLQEVWGRQFNDNQEEMDLESTISRLRSMVETVQVRGTTIIEVQVTSRDSAEAAAIANKIAEVFQETRLASVKKKYSDALVQMQEEMDQQKFKVRELEDNVEDLRLQNQIVFGATGAELSKERLDQLQLELERARLDLWTAEAQLQKVESLEGKQLEDAIPFLVNDPSYNTLNQQLVEAEIAYRAAEENYGPKHPEMVKFQTTIDELRRAKEQKLVAIKEGLASRYDVAQRRVENLEQEMDLLRNQDLERHREAFLPFERALRDRDAAKQVLTALEHRVAQEVIELEIPSTPVEVVETAVEPRSPFSPSWTLNILASIFGGLFLGVALAYFIEYMDTSVKTIDDVERFLGLPVLGIIPQRVRPLVEEGPDSPHAEAYRVLRTNLQFAAKDPGANAITIVSGGVGEGKSTTLFNLAYVCAQLGDKVLLVDSDLRRPALHKFLGMSNDFGLTNVLMRDVPIEETIKSTSVPNLHFLPSGKLPRTSVGILNSQRMRELIKTLKSRYDYIFFDSPPIVGVSDASVLASEVDLALLVVQYRKYPKVMSNRAKKMVENVGGRLVGVVLNNINVMRDDYYYYYHTYYSHYYGPQEERTPDRPKELDVGEAY